MRIVHLADYGGPYSGSFIPMLRAVNDAVVQRGWSFEAVFTEVAAERPWYGELEVGGITVRVAPEAGRKALGTWLEHLLAERAQPTILHTHFTRFDLPAVAVAHRHDGVAVVWHLHSQLRSNPTAMLRNTMRLALAGRRVDAILCVSDEIRRAARWRLAPNNRLVTFPNAIDLERFLPAATREERERSRARLGIPVGLPLLVHFGWDWERKGGDLFVSTVNELSQSGLNVIGLSVGGGDSARAASARLDLGDRVLIVEPSDDVRGLYAAADVFVSPSRAEGMPYAVLEALCTGTPVVISNIPSHVQLAGQVVGCTMAESRPQAFAEAIRHTLGTHVERGAPVDITGLLPSLDLHGWANRLTDLYAEIDIPESTSSRS